MSFSVKLPHSRFFVLDLPNTEPTHYGLGKHGWVTARFPSTPKDAVETYKMWVEESYRSVAPKKLLAHLDEPEAPPKGKPAAKRRAVRGTDS